MGKPIGGEGDHSAALYFSKIKFASPLKFTRAVAAAADWFGESRRSFWLDSAKVVQGARFSFLGDDRGPHSYCVRYDVHNRTIERITQQSDGSEERNTLPSPSMGFLGYLKQEMAAWGKPVLVSCDEDNAQAEVPFNFLGGFVGYLGYELRHECGE